jgi:hypothetical protein
MSTALPNPARGSMRLLVTLGVGLLIVSSGVLAVSYVVDWVEDFTWHQ